MTILRVTGVDINGRAVLGDPGSTPLASKVSRLNECLDSGVRIPETVLIDVDGVAGGSGAIAVALAAGSELLLGDGSSADVFLAIRRVAGGPRIWPALLDVPCFRPGAELPAAVTSWLAGDGQPVRSFLVQRMRPDGFEPGACRGVISSRLANGTAGAVGFVYDNVATGAGSAEMITFDLWRSRHVEKGQVIAKWARDIERLAKSPCRVAFGMSHDAVYLLSAHSSIGPRWVNCRVLVDLVNAGALTQHEAIIASAPDDVIPQSRALTNPRQLVQLAVGSSGDATVVTGRAMISAVSTDVWEHPTILLRDSVSPSDATSIGRSAGIAVAGGGASSHMVVLARGLGKTVLTGVAGLSVDTSKGIAKIGTAEVCDGDWLTVDGVTGALYLGRGVIAPINDTASETIIGWSRSPEIPVLMNADFASEVEAGAWHVADGIGLCRSERHLRSPAEFALLERFFNGDSSDAVKHSLLSSLTSRLEEVLVAIEGQTIHYRLLDPGDFRAAGSVGGHSRGTRWGIVSGFYTEQIQSVTETVKRVASAGCPVDLVLVAPFVGLVDEARWIERTLHSSLGAVIPPAVRIRVGCMIETPLGVAHSPEIAAVADVVCVGTNDLTEQFWGVNRNDSEDFFTRYEARGLLDDDPFQVLKMSEVGGLVATVVQSARRARLDASVVVCGEHASVTRNARLWTELGRPAFSARPSAVGPMRVALYQNADTSEASPRVRIEWPEPTRHTLCRDVLRRIRLLVRLGEVENARACAWNWALVMSRSFGLPSPTNWKFFKRDLVAHWFGSNPSRRFRPGWSADDVAAYAETLRAALAGVRFSLFPATIACHALSELLPPNGSPFDWRYRIGELDRTCSIEVFPQQSPSKMCFRAILREGTIQAEAGLGQAMYVFEQERGRHPVTSGQLYPHLTGRASTQPSATRLDQEFQRFTADCGESLVSRMLTMQAELGSEWLGVEGYYDPTEPLFVCDADLPADMAFHALAGAGPHGN